MNLTIKDIAMESGYSTATVSKVLNAKDNDVSESTRNKILKIADKYNFQLNRAASSLVLNKTNTIGILVPDISNPFFTDIAKGAEDYAYKNGYSLYLCNSYESLEKEINYMKSMIQLRVDGVLIVGAKYFDEEVDEPFPLDIPAVEIDRDSIYKNIPYKVQTDHYKGACLAMDYLIEKGHKKILFVAGPKNSNSAHSRYEAYVDKMNKNNFNIFYEDIHSGDFSIEHGYTSILNIKDLRKYTAIFCCNDLIAIGAMAALKELKLNVPNDISLIGVDNIDLSILSTPPLTTMGQPAYKLGFEGCKMLIESTHSNLSKTTVTLAQELVIRETVKDIKY